MEQERLALLKAEMQAQVKEINNIYAKLEDRKKSKGVAAIESIAYQLHNLYCAFENLFRIIAVSFDNHIEEESRYHTELLKRMAFSIEGVRPALLSRDSFVLLDNLRSFRHFFRHAYSSDLDERKVQIVLEDVAKLRELYARDIEGFIKIWTS